MDRAEFLRRGWCVFPPEPSVTDWVVATAPAALACAHDGRARTRWLRHGGTWFAGVNILENDALGRVGGGPPLSGAALDMAQEIYGPLRLDRPRYRWFIPVIRARIRANRTPRIVIAKPATPRMWTGWCRRARAAAGFWVKPTPGSSACRLTARARPP